MGYLSSISSKYDFTVQIDLALQHLQATASDYHKIGLARKYKEAQEWLFDAVRKVVYRKEPPTGCLIGMEDIIMIGQIRYYICKLRGDEQLFIELCLKNPSKIVLIVNALLA